MLFLFQTSPSLIKMCSKSHCILMTLMQPSAMANVKVVLTCLVYIRCYIVQLDAVHCIKLYTYTYIVSRVTAHAAAGKEAHAD